MTRVKRKLNFIQTPSTGIRLVTTEGMTTRFRGMQRPFERAPRASRPPPDEWVSQKAQLHFVVG